MSLSYRKTTLDDFDILADLRLTSMRESLEAIGRYDSKRSRERFRASFCPENTQMVYKDDVLIGFFAITEHSDHLYLDHLYILPTFQSAGLGSIILKMLFKFSDNKNLPIKLGALRSSKSNQFYEKHGFTKIREDDWDIYYQRSID